MVCEGLSWLLGCSVSVSPWLLFLLAVSSQPCKMKCTNIFEVPEMPEAEVLEEEEEVEAVEEVAAVAEPGEPEVSPAEGIGDVLKEPAMPPQCCSAQCSFPLCPLWGGVRAAFCHYVSL